MEHRLGPLMGFVGRLSKQYIDHALRDYDVPPIQGHIIHYLIEHDGQCSQKVLEQVLMVKPSTVNGVVCRLEEKGMISRRDNPADARCKILLLTDRGRRFASDFCRVAMSADEVALAGFSNEEKQQFYSFLERIIGNYQSVEEDKNK